MIYIVSVAGRDWFRGLCFMLPLLAVLERPDMPREVLGIGGLNPFNILMLIVLIAWFWFNFKSRTAVMDTVQKAMETGSDLSPDLLAKLGGLFGGDALAAGGRCPDSYPVGQQAFDPLLTPGARNYWKSHNFRALSDRTIDTVLE